MRDSIWLILYGLSVSLCCHFEPEWGDAVYVFPVLASFLYSFLLRIHHFRWIA